MLLEVLIELKQIKKSTDKILKLWNKEKDTKNITRSIHLKNLISLIDETKPSLDEFTLKLDDIKQLASNNIRS